MDKHGAGRGAEPPPPLWLALLAVPLGLGVAALGVLFLHHALFTQHPPGTKTVNPAFSVVVVGVGAAGFVAGLVGVWRALFSPSPSADEAPPVGQPPQPRPLAPLPDLEGLGPARPRGPASVPVPPELPSEEPGPPGPFLRCLFWLMSAELKMWVGAVFLTGFGLWDLCRQEWAASRWRPARAVVVDAGVTPKLRFLKPARPPFVPRLLYRYVADGRAFESVRLSTGDHPLLHTDEEVADFLARYPVGGMIPVLVHPDDPAQATLRVHRDTVGACILLGFGLFLLAFVLLVRRGPPTPHIDLTLTV